MGHRSMHSGRSIAQWPRMHHTGGKGLADNADKGRIDFYSTSETAIYFRESEVPNRPPINVSGGLRSPKVTEDDRRHAARKTGAKRKAKTGPENENVFCKRRESSSNAIISYGSDQDCRQTEAVDPDPTAHAGSATAAAAQRGLGRCWQLESKVVIWE